MVRRQTPAQRKASLRNLKKARAARGGRRRRPVRRVIRRVVARRRTRRASFHNPGRAPGIVAKINKGLRALKLGLPAIRSFTAGLSPGDALKDAGTRYTGFDFETMSFDMGKAKVTAGFYAGNIVEQKALSMMNIPQMAGRKKLLSVVGQYLPEMQAAGDFMAGVSPANVGQSYGRRSIGYDMINHDSWFTNSGLRNDFLKTLGARLGLGLISRFVGPMVNKHLPKGVNI